MHTAFRSNDVGGRAGELIEHHQERLDHLLQEFADDKLTVWDVAAKMKWYKAVGRDLPDGKDDGRCPRVQLTFAIWLPESRSLRSPAPSPRSSPSSI